MKRQTNVLPAVRYGKNSCVLNRPGKLRTISHAIKLLLDGQAKSSLVTENGVPFESIDRDDIIRCVKEFDEIQPVQQIAQRELIYVKSSTPLNDVFIEFRGSRTPLILVVEAEQLAGIINTDNIAEVIMIHNTRQV